MCDVSASELNFILFYAVIAGSTRGEHNTNPADQASHHPYLAALAVQHLLTFDYTRRRTKHARRNAALASNSKSAAQRAPPLEEVERSARRRNVAGRKAAREKEKSTEAEDQPDRELAVQDAHQASLDTGAREGLNEVPPEDSERGPNSESQGASTSDAPAQASVGDAVKVEPPAADDTSESSQPVQDVVTLDDADDESARITCKEEGLLPAVQEEPVPHVRTEAEQPSPDVTTSTLATQSNAQEVSPESTPVQTSPMIIDLTGGALPDVPARSDGPTVARVKTYVTDQVRRWERVTTEFVVSPTIEYSWPTPPPDFQAWWAAVMPTSEYIEAWISEWNLVRLAPNMMTDFTAITVSPTFTVWPAATVVDPVSELTSVLPILGTDDLGSRQPKWSDVRLPECLFETHSGPGVEFIGTAVAGSDESSFSNVSGSRSSRRASSSSSSMWSLSSTHMPHAGLTGVVMMAQGGVARGGGDVGIQISDATLLAPLVPVGQDDVVMSGSGHVSIRSDHHPKKTPTKSRRQKASPSESASDSSSDAETRRSRRISRREGRSSKRGPKSRRSPTQSTKSEWTNREGCLGCGLSAAIGRADGSRPAKDARYGRSTQSGSSYYQSSPEVQRTRPRNIPATLPLVQGTQATVGTDSATLPLVQGTQATVGTDSATLPLVQGTQATVGTDSATLPRSDQFRMALHPESSGLIMGHGGDRLDKPISDLSAAQLRATLQPMIETKYAKTETTSKVATTRASRVTARKPESKSTEPTRSELKRSASRRSSDKKHSGQRGDPSDDSSSPGSSDDDSSDDDSDSSSGGAPLQVTTTTTLGGTTLAFRSYVSSSTLEDFDEDAPLHARRRWWDPFMNLTAQGRWSDRTNVYELKLKMPPAVRNWIGQLSRHDRQDWSRLSRHFKREFCKSKLSEAERYYTMTQRKGEKAPAFLYRLNLAGLVILPDEESILMYGDVIQRRQGLDLPVMSPVGLHLRPGESANVRIRYGQSDSDVAGLHIRSTSTLVQHALMDTLGWATLQCGHQS
ncbi:unnamed protein product [Phytophthora fragariaefolia]|uniref:Unnamed protein product n=1 Tax=Phytophthora fragariaefolia TaxID=1490495 RepID=A0A9W6TXH5_9STRA|nr:unnamed protein product [Phytophthora fragariaefolia]